jgi:hypothetical protein
MIRRAVFSPGLQNRFSQNVLVALGMGAAVVLLGCGGGGGGGNGGCGGGGGGADLCTDNPNSGLTVICGYVIEEGTTNGVNGAVVSVKTASGAVLKSKPTYTNASSGKSGYYVLEVPATAALIAVAPPSATHLPSYFRHGTLSSSPVYDINRPTAGGEPCNPAIPSGLTAGVGNIGPNFAVFSRDGLPPSPVFSCPRDPAP